MTPTAEPSPTAPTNPPPGAVTAAPRGPARSATDGPIRLDGTLVDDGRRTANATVVLAGGRVAYAGPTRELPPAYDQLSTPPGWRDDVLLLPGLVDLHQHGGAGGEYGPDPAAARVAAAHHHAHGSTALVASLVSNRPELLESGTAACAGLVAEGILEGVHLEGPFLSHARRGAQNPAVLTDVDLRLVERLVAAAADAGAPEALVQMTFAPERAGAVDLPAELARHGIVGAVGHTDGSATEASAAIERVVRGGAREGRAIATHIFNGMRPLHHRDPGPVAACLAAAARGELVLEVIGDGAHLDPGTVGMLFDLVGPDAIALITDALSACGMPPGRYRLGELDIVVDEEVCRLADGDSIAGSIATLLDVLRWTTTAAGVPLEAAVIAATATPAAVAGLGAGSARVGGPGSGAGLWSGSGSGSLGPLGRLVPGARGDVLALREYDDAGRPLALEAVFRAGRRL